MPRKELDTFAGKDLFGSKKSKRHDELTEVVVDKQRRQGGDQKNKFPKTGSSSTSEQEMNNDKVTFRDRNDNNSNSPSEEKLNENSPGVYKGIIANVSPRDNLMFNVTDDKKETLDLLSILNTTSGTIAFKVKTTSPDSYRVRPSTALIKPGDTSVVSIYLQPGYMDSVFKDKFLIMIMVVSDRVRSTMEIVDLWKQPPSNHDEYMEHRLQCVAKKVDRDFTPDPGYRRAMALRQDSSRSDPTSKTTSGDQGLSSSTQEISGTSTEESTLASIERKSDSYTPVIKAPDSPPKPASEVKFSTQVPEGKPPPAPAPSPSPATHYGVKGNEPEFMDLMLTRQSDLDKSVGRLYKFQIFIVFLMSCVVVLFLVVYVMEWRALDLYTEAIHYYQNT